MTKGDLISREEARGKFQTVTEWNGEVHRYIDEQSLDSIPSADIMECARAIKEYCKDRTNKPIWCNDCPLYEPFCKINTPPNMWDLPEGEKGGAE